MSQYLTIQDKHRTEYNEAWARRTIAARTDISQDPRCLYRCLDGWAREYRQGALATLKIIRREASRGNLTPAALKEELESFLYFRQLASSYLAARNSIYREVCEAAEKMQAFVKSGCKSQMCHTCDEREFAGDPHDHSDYYSETTGSGRGDREDFHADG